MFERAKVFVKIGEFRKAERDLRTILNTNPFFRDEILKDEDLRGLIL